MKVYETTRRALLKTAGAAAAASAPLTGALAADNAGGRAKLELKVAGYDYDRVRAIMDGRATVEGAEVDFQIGELLLRENLITREQLDKALTEQQQGGTRIGFSLVSSGAVSEPECWKFG